jgi:hypothetical protein
MWSLVRVRRRSQIVYVVRKRIRRSTGGTEGKKRTESLSRMRAMRFAMGFAIVGDCVVATIGSHLRISRNQG